MELNLTISILAYNKHDITNQNIKHLCSMGYSQNIFLFDNGSSPSFDKISKRYGIRYYKEENNIFVNPAWNKIFKIENPVVP